jgi:hypothetical protein
MAALNFYIASEVSARPGVELGQSLSEKWQIEGVWEQGTEGWSEGRIETVACGAASRFVL